MVTLDFLSKKEYKTYYHSHSSVLIIPERLPEETTTQAIVQKVLSGVEDQISDPEVVGVIRSYESPNTEKDVLIVKEEQDIYHVIISIVNTGEGADYVTPII